MAAHEHAGERQNRGNEAEQGPKSLSPYVQSAEMCTRKPGKDHVAQAELGGPFAIHDVDEAIERLRETEIEA